MQPYKKSATSPIIKRTKSRLIFSFLQINYWIEALKVYKSFQKARLSLKKLSEVKKKYFGRKRLGKIARVDGKYYWVAGGPALFSPALKTFIRVGLNKMLPYVTEDDGLQVLFLAITRKCPLRCEHCFEGENLGSEEVLSFDDLTNIINYFQERGVAQIQFSGGEPMSRFSDLVNLLKASKPGTDFWMNTSGFQLNDKKAQELKSAGLTGCIISLDHFRASDHNQFRRNPLAYGWAIDATSATVKASMPVTLSLCATRDFISMDNLLSYAALAKDLGVTFIQLLEPKATGFYKNKDVILHRPQKLILEEFYWKMNFEPQYRYWPIVNYFEFHKQAINCGGAGDRFLYINSKGHIQACPFCEKSFGQVLKTNTTATIRNMQKTGCTATLSMEEAANHSF